MMPCSSCGTLTRTASGAHCPTCRTPVVSGSTAALAAVAGALLLGLVHVILGGS